MSVGDPSDGRETEVAEDQTREHGQDDGDRRASERPPPVASTRDALLWGVVGGLVFLVLHQGYLLAGGRFLGVVPVAAVTLLVGGVVAGTGLWLARRASGNGQR